jgi:hypothetical protein
MTIWISVQQSPSSKMGGIASIYDWQSRSATYLLQVDVALALLRVQVRLGARCDRRGCRRHLTQS